MLDDRSEVGRQSVHRGRPRVWWLAAIGGAFIFAAPGILSAQPDLPATRITPAARDTLRVAGTPVFTAAADDRCLLNGVGAILPAPDGGLVVLNAREAQFCEFGPSGALVATHGRRGEGPGEYAFPRYAQRFGPDSILVYDASQRRFSVLDGRGRYVRTLTLAATDADSRAVTTVLALGDRQLVVGFSDVAQRAPSPEPQAFTQTLFLFAPDGALRRSLGGFPATEHFIQAAPPQMGGAAYWERAFGRRAAFAAVPGGFVSGDGGSFDLRRFDATGKAVARLTGAGTPRAVTPADIARYRAFHVDREIERGAPAEEIRRERERVDAMPYPARYPAYRALLTDAQGDLWLAPFADPSGVGDDPDVWRHWQLATGRERLVRMPPRFRPLHVDDARVCGVQRDADDVEAVVCVARPGRRGAARPASQARELSAIVGQQRRAHPITIRA